jgi:hypothetical protein
MALSGHPDVSWSILLEAGVADALDPDTVAGRLRAAFGSSPHLGRPPPVRSILPDDIPAALRMFANRPYEDGESVARVGVWAKPPTILLAAHHGALDGLGLVALLGVVLDAAVSSSARGIGSIRPGHGFVRTASSRLWEALVDRPSRIAPVRTGVRRTETGGDLLLAAPVGGTTRTLGTATLVAAAVAAIERWNAEAGAPSGRVAVAIGASRRPGSAPTLEERSAYLRLHAASSDPAHLRALLRDARPQAGAARFRGATAIDRVVPASLKRALSDRLGSTLLVSNLAQLKGAGLRSAAFYPVAHGVSGVALGAARVEDTTTITIRARLKDFDAEGARRLLGCVVDALHDNEPG